MGLDIDLDQSIWRARAAIASGGRFRVTGGKHGKHDRKSRRQQMVKPSETAAVLAAVLSVSDDAIVTESTEGIITGWNQGAERVFGYSAMEALGRPVSFLAAPGHPDDTASVREQAMRGESVSRYETVRRHKNGAVLQISLSVLPIREASGKILGLVRISRDVTAQKNVRMLQEEGEAHLSSIIEAIPDGMIVIDPDGTMRSFSPAAERIFGYGAAEVLGRNVKMLMPATDRDRHDGYLARYARTGERQIIGIGRTVIGQRKDGTTFPMDLAVGEAKVHGHRQFTGFVRDVTERKEAETRLMELQSELLHVARLSAMGEMATTLAHELNQPLTAVVNYSEAARQILADSGVEVPAKVTEFVQKAAGQAERAGQIIRRLRGFVERREVERTTENLNEVVQEAANLAAIGARADGIRIQFDLADALSEIQLDKTQIQQVVVNLVRNAIDVLRDAERRVLIVRTADNGGEAEEVAVIDSGPGIAPEVAERLFQPFVTSKKDGMGIGLAVSRTIIEAHGGRLWSEPNPGGGAVFRFRLPIGLDRKQKKEDQA